MKKRWWWSQSEDKNSQDVYFSWLQVKDKTFFQSFNRKKGSKSSDSSSTTHGMTNSINDEMSCSVLSSKTVSDG